MGHSSAERTNERLHYIAQPRRYREARPPALQIQLHASLSLDNTYRWTFIIGGSLDVGHLRAKYHRAFVHPSTYPHWSWWGYLAKKIGIGYLMCTRYLLVCNTMFCTSYTAYLIDSPVFHYIRRESVFVLPVFQCKIFRSAALISLISVDNRYEL